MNSSKPKLSSSLLIPKTSYSYIEERMRSFSYVKENSVNESLHVQRFAEELSKKLLKEKAACESKEITPPQITTDHDGEELIFAMDSP